MNRHQLRWRRMGLGLSQAQFGRMIGQKQAVISRWESGSRPIPDWVHARVVEAENIKDAAYQRVVDVLDHAADSGDVPSLQLTVPTVAATPQIVPQTETLRAGAAWALIEKVGASCADNPHPICQCRMDQMVPPALVHTMPLHADSFLILGDTIRTWRIGLGLTQQHLARLGNVTQSTVAALEHGGLTSMPPGVMTGLHNASALACDAYDSYAGDSAQLPPMDDQALWADHPDTKKLNLPASLWHIGWAWAHYGATQQNQSVQNA